MAKPKKFGPLAIRYRKQVGNLARNWQLDIPGLFTPTGKRLRLGFETKLKAVEEAKKRLREIQAKGQVGAAGLPASGAKLNDVWPRWFDDELSRVRRGLKKSNTFDVDLERLKAIMAFLGNDDLSKIDKRRLATYQEYRIGQGRKHRTINSEIGTLSLILFWAKEHGLIQEVPRVERLTVHRQHVVVPTPEELARIMDALPQRLRVLFRLLAETGCRKGEAFNLEWTDVNVVQGYVDIRPKEGGWTPKTAHSERRIYLSEGLRGSLASLPTKSRYVFPGRDPHKPLNNFRKALAAAVTKAGVNRGGKPLRVTPHVLRKAYATWQAMGMVPEAVLQDLLGHAPGSRVTKQHYVFSQEKAKREAVFELPTREKKRNGDR